MSSGSSRRTSRYISSRHVQKSSVGWPRNSASPAMARWNECECTLGMPGSTTPPATAASGGRSARAVTRAIAPASSHSMSTSLAQPDGRSASEAWRAGMARMITAMARHLLVNARLATMRGGKYSLVEKGVMAVADGKIERVGPINEWGPGPWKGGPGDEVIDAHGAVVTPGLVDCHT